VRPGCVDGHASRRAAAVDIDLWREPQGRPVLHTRLPAPLRRRLRKLEGSELVVLSPRPGLTVASTELATSAGERLRFVALRHPRWPHGPARLLIPLSVQVLLSLLILALVGLRVTRGIVLPLAAVQRAARRVAGGDLTARVGALPGHRDDELQQLAADFDRMAARVEALMTHMRGLLQDVSHELRSPLTRLQLKLEMARDSGDPALLDQAQNEILRLDQLIGEVLALARLESRMPERLDEPVILAPLLAECLEVAEAAEQPCELRLDAPLPELSVLGDRALLGRLFDNLIGNACKYGAGSLVEVRLRQLDDQAVVDVMDRGPGIAEEERNHLFRPFYRGAAAAGQEGQGLGLAIVERIARAHGGEVEASNRPGGGAWLRVRLPLTAPGNR
jgi:Signal transduction histidine kinase